MQASQTYRERRASMKCNLDLAVAQYQQRRQSLRDDASTTSTTLSALRARRNSISNRPLHLLDLPTEILEQILGYVHPSHKAIHVARVPDSSEFSPSDITTGAIRTKWRIQNFPSALFLVNSRISALVFARVWCDTAFVLSMSPTDALCFLKYALSERQRGALRRIRFTRFMLSWEDGVGDDIWLSDFKRAPKFLEHVSPRVDGPRVDGLVRHLQGKSKPGMAGTMIEA